MPAMTFAAAVKSLAALLLLAASPALSNISALFVCQIIAHSVWTIMEMASRWSEPVADESSPRERQRRWELWWRRVGILAIGSLGGCTT